ncbi:MAG: RES family NAD+ phosphorylase [Xanthomonadales bacterium]|nr:RES family NAD+ phosphorylase [Xanthomonadales bacterium]
MPSGAKRRPVPWGRHHRIIPSRFPPVSAFEDTADPADLDAVFETEALTNDRLRDQAGALNLVPPDQRVSGPGSTVVMAAFTHIGRAGRFNEPDFGAYYASESSATAIAETRFHRARFMALTDEAPARLEMREYVGAPTQSSFVDLRGGAHEDLLDPDPEGYARPQAVARQWREQGEHGVLYPSVRRAEGECLAAFRPDAVGLPRQAAHYVYIWDGKDISEVLKLTRVV